MKNYLLLFCAFLFFACNNSEQQTGDAGKKDTASKALQPDKQTTAFKVLSFDKNEHFFEDSIKGTVVEGFSWRDAESEHRVLFTTVPVKMNKNGRQSGAVYAYCFIQSGGAWQKEWEVKDRIDDCEVDATCEFLPNSFTVTDNDNNGLGEVCFLYKLSCKGDVSPDEKKLIMYEGANKYAIRGSTILEYNGSKEGGDKKIDASFTKAAKPLLDFANSQWDKFGITKY
ncbi:MAG: hypothetical protein IPI88_01300 [Chitinophagaceae bacterium]|nr:hypothetical protein [Chitinophagaceae bacterium]